MTHFEEAELHRLRQRQIEEDNPYLNFLIKIQDQIFKIFQKSELSV